uniref:Copper transport protein ATOX1 n=1 Tax=Culicoides sonorensis TaxID=179676 RepID=A0A336M1J9_CULSO
MSQTYEFNVAMTCDGCKNSVNRVLSKLEDKIEKVDFDVPGKKVWVTSQMSADEVLEVIKKTNLETSYVGLKA